MVDTGVMTRFQTSWEIAKRSWAILKSDKTLAWFPVLSFLGSLVVFGAVAGPIALAGIDRAGTNDSLAPMGYVFAAVGYVALAFVQTYFLAALVAGADTRLQGGHSTVSSALEVANSRLHRLLPWALVSATVTIILQAIEERFGIVGRIVASLVGLAWNLITFLTIPILVIEDLGVGAALTRSKDLFKKTWGENVVGQAGLGIVGFLALLPAVLLFAIGASLGTAGLIGFGAVAVPWIIVAATVTAALSGIYRTVLYRFAASGRVPDEFAGVDLQSAFRPRGNDGGSSAGGFGGGFGGFSRN
jgi:Family of unknown function (DUF6159)